MDKKEERLHRALAALQAYCRNPRNPLAGPGLAGLLNEFFAAADDIRKDAGTVCLRRTTELSSWP